MEQLRFIKPEKKSDDEISKLVGDLWAELGKEQAIESNKLILFLAAMILIQLKVEEIPALSLEEIQRIHKKYQLFFLNRKSNKPKKKQMEDTMEEKSLHKPSICAVSINLAESGREKYGMKEQKSDESGKGTSFVLLADALIQNKRSQQE